MFIQTYSNERQWWIKMNKSDSGLKHHFNLIQFTQQGGSDNWLGVFRLKNHHFYGLPVSNMTTGGHRYIKLM